MRRVKYVIRLREKFPELTLPEIAKKANTSVENVWQMLKRRNLPTRAVREPKPKVRKPRRRWCKICGKIVVSPKGAGAAVHPGACAFQHYYVKLVCEWCRTPFYRKRAVQDYRIRQGRQKTYCSIECFKKYRSFHSANKR